LIFCTTLEILAALNIPRRSRQSTAAARRAASNIQDFTDGVSHACHTSRYTGFQTPAGTASHLADLATARVEGTPSTFPALAVFRVP